LGAFAADLARKFRFLSERAAWRLARSYGTDAYNIFRGVRGLEDVGHLYGAGFSTRELEWLMREEWARTAEDVLWRRSKLGLHLSREDQAAIAAKLETRQAA
jgi:glycerol-3-phosphate dehydrogenase